MEYPVLGEALCNGEAIVVAVDRQAHETARGRPWYVLAVRLNVEGDEPLHPYVTWEYLGDGRITEGEYYKDVLEAAVDLKRRAGVDVVLDWR
jgi:hypothetical protein